MFGLLKLGQFWLAGYQISAQGQLLVVVARRICGHPLGMFLNKDLWNDMPCSSQVHRLCEAFSSIRSCGGSDLFVEMSRLEGGGEW